jgi:uncharacterized membrane protein YgaE (UPF0421/DUF939 family)
LYILSLLLWISIYVWAVRICELVNLISKPLKFIFSLLATWAISLLGIPRYLAGRIIDNISSMNSTLAKIILGIAIFFLIVLLDFLSASIRDQIKGLKKNVDEKKLKKDVKKTEREVKRTKERLAKDEEYLAEKERSKRNKNEGLSDEEVEKIEEEVEEDTEDLGEEE